MLLYIKTIRTYIFFILISTTFSLLCLPLALLPEKIRYENRSYFVLTTIWTKLLVFFSFIWVKKEGEHNLPKYPESPAIFVMNHASYIDVPIIETVIKSYPHIWIAKQGLEKLPIFKTLLNRMHVTVNKQDPKLAARALVKAYNLAKNRTSHILMFPEGQRYSDGKVHDFLKGFTFLAKKLNRPVIPIAILGTDKILGVGKFLFDPRSSAVKIIIGEPIFFSQEENEEIFVKRVRDWFEKCIS